MLYTFCLPVVLGRGQATTQSVIQESPKKTTFLERIKVKTHRIQGTGVVTYHLVDFYGKFAGRCPIYHGSTKISYSLASGTPIFSRTFMCHYINLGRDTVWLWETKKSLHRQKSNELIPNNDGPWQIYLRIQAWCHSGYQFV